VTIPRHPEEHDDLSSDTPRSRARNVLIALGAVLIVVIVVLHLTGVIGR
jgi:hypothetical protein